MMISRPGINNPRAGGRAAFTLVELVLVMALLVVLVGVAAPSLSRSLHGHTLALEAERLLALTEYARDEAVSQGIPMAVWLDSDGGHFGVDAKPGYAPDGGGDNPRARDYQVSDDVHFDPVGQGMTAPTPAPTGGTAAAAVAPAQTGVLHGGVAIAILAPDGTLDPNSLPSVHLTNRAGDALTVAQTADGSGYEIVKGSR